MNERKDPGDEILRQLRELAEKSMEANTRVAQNGAELLKRLAEGGVTLSDLAASSNEVLNRAIQEYVRLSAEHASRLIDLGVDVSHGVLSAARPPGVAREREPGGPLFDLEMEGRPGELCQTAFFLESDQAEPLTSGFTATALVDESGAEAEGLELSFDPAEVTMQPGTRERIVVRVNVPKSAETGRYHSVVSLEANRSRQFRVVVTVTGDAFDGDQPGAEETGREIDRAANNPEAEPEESARKGKATPAASSAPQGKSPAKGRSASKDTSTSKRRSASKSESTSKGRSTPKANSGGGKPKRSGSSGGGKSKRSGSSGGGKSKRSGSSGGNQKG